MNAEVLTIVSGVALLGVFALVGWRLRRMERSPMKRGMEDPDGGPALGGDGERNPR